MRKFDIANDDYLRLLSSTEMCEMIPSLLEKHYGIQMANIWKFGVSTGLYLDIMLKIKMNSISDEKATVTTIKARTDETHEVFLPSEALDIIYSIRMAHPNSTYLFQSHRSRNIAKKISSPLTRQAVSLAFREVGKILGISITPRTMRQMHLVQSIDRLSPSERKLIESYVNIT
ncbi:hypothetical protein ACPV5T_02945 [Vibrio astriarenae]|uniref:hypothetical protein n=1 Tax=Vibrio sp. Makdt TaxID=2998828 RepID=UPI0022CD9ED5|nr:hypothetical protein [Vibrio sp. Makdt]MDA0155149.1 hypothetical protein [Vibrio sp. Makdt]